MRLGAAFSALSALSLGCADPAPADDRAPDDTAAAPLPEDTAVATEPTIPAPTADTGEVPTTPPWELQDFDCSTIVPGPVPFTRLAWAPSAEDFTFSPDGGMYAVSAGVLKRTPFGGPAEVLVPNLGDVRGTRFLPDGRLALAHPADASVWLVDPATGDGLPLGGSLDTPNGVAIDLEGRIAVATHHRIVQLDPATGASRDLAVIQGRSFDGLTYSPDFRRLYFNEELGWIHYVEFDAAGDPGPVQDLVQMPVTPLSPFSILDGMAMDACGNLYANQMSGRVWRITPTGEMEVVADIGGLSIIPALNFGLPDRDGWSLTHLYVMDFTGNLYDLDVGVPGKWEPHLPVPTR
jgi:hypothetical protein